MGMWNYNCIQIQNRIDLSEGRGLQYVWNYETESADPTDAYEGSPVARTNDSRKRPLLWSRRHCRIYSDPYGGSFPWSKDYFEVISFQHGIPHPEYDDFLHMGLKPGTNEADAIRREGISGNSHRAHKESRVIPAVEAAPAQVIDPHFSNLVLPE